MNSPFAAISHGVAVNIVATLATVVGGVIAARGLGAAGRGTAAALVALPTFVSFIATAGLPSALIYEARKDPDAAPQLLGAGLFVAVGIGLLAWLATWLYTPHMLAGLPPDLMAAGRMLSVFGFAGILSNVGIAALQSQRAFVACNVIRLAQPLIQLAGLVALEGAGQLRPVPVALLTLSAGIPGITWNLGWIHRNCTLHLDTIAAALRRLLHYAARAAAGELVAGMAGQIDKVIVVGLFAPQALGLYVVAMSLSRVLAIIPSAVVPVLFPATAGRSPPEVLDVTSRAAAMTAVCVAAGAVVLGAVGPWLLRLFYGSDFTGAGWAFRLLLVEAALSAVAQVLAQAFLALNRPVLAALQQGLGVAIAAALLYTLTPRWGLAGAATALLAAAVTRLASSYHAFRLIGAGMPAIRPHIGPSIARLYDIVVRLVPTRPSIPPS